MARLSTRDPFLAAFRATGSVGKAAASARMHRSLHYRRLKEDPAYNRAFERICADLQQKGARQILKKIPDAEDRLRDEIRVLRHRVSELGRDLRAKIRALESNAIGPPRPRQPAEPTDPLLDQIAHGMAKKRFSKLSPLHQDAVRSLAEKIRGESPD